MQIYDPTLLENLDMRQRQTLVSRELALWRAGAKRRAQTNLSKSSFITRNLRLRTRLSH